MSAVTNNHNSKKAVTHVLYLGSKHKGHVLGGAETQLWSFLPALVATGIDTELIVLIWHDSQEILPAIERLRASGVTVTVIKRAAHRTRFGCWYASATVFAELFKQLVARTDRVLNMHLDHIFVPSIALLAGCRNAVFSFHADHPIYKRATMRAWFWFLRKTGVVTRFTALSEYVRSYVIKTLQIPVQQCFLVRYGIERQTPLTKSERLQRLQRYGISTDKPVVGFVGRLVEQKNLPFLIRAMSKLPQLELVIAGGGPLESQLHELVNQHQIKNVSFLGPVQSGKDLIAALDILVLPSTWEGLGLVLLEALACGVPVAGARAGAIPEVLGADQPHAQIGELFSPTDEQELIDALTLICAQLSEGSAAVREERLQRTQQWLAQRYSLSVSAQAYSDGIWAADIGEHKAKA